MNAPAKIEDGTGGEIASYGDSLLQVIAKAARDPAVDIDKMERLLQMQERVQDREAEVSFSSAFAKMQPELPAINMRGQIVHKGNVISDYAEWSDVAKAITPVLSRYGFSLSFKPTEVGGKVAVCATLRHEDGHTDSSTLSLPTDTSGAKNAVQAVGSTLTYGKRYSAILLLNIRVEGDDDDGAASGPKISHEGPRDMPFPQGPAKNKTELKAKGREVWAKIEAVKNRAELEAILEKEGKLLFQIREALPSWWYGGQRPDQSNFEGLGAIITRIQGDFDANDAMGDY